MKRIGNHGHAGRRTPRADSTPRWPRWTPVAAHALRLPTRRRDDPRIAFAIHFSELVNHYGPIWERLDPESFEIVYASEHSEDNERVAAYAKDHGYRARYVADVLREGRCYATVVSNHIGAAGNDGTRFIVSELGRRQVRLMYSLGKDGWNFRDWNDLYDLILCFGPYQAAKLAEFDRPRVVQVGYPRFDRFFHMPETRAEILGRHGLDPARRTLVWLPTWGPESSIAAFAQTIADLRTELNVVVKVHPMTPEANPEQMAALAAAGIAPVADANLDNVELFYVADVVAADYGGSPFGAIYADRDLVLLDTPLPDGATELSPADSLDSRIREWIVNIDPGEGSRILEYLADPAARAQQAEVRERLRRSLFAPFFGCAADVAAAVLRNIEHVCGSVPDAATGTTIEG